MNIHHSTAPRSLSEWTPDVLGAGFESLSIELGPDPDGEGTVRTTVIAFNRSAPGWGKRPALLWVHGMSDYFFNDRAARFFDAAGFAFYAVDLRKCGRSHQPGQTWHYTTDLKHHYRDLNAVLDVIPQQRVIPVAHSTGGLIVAQWLNDAPETHSHMHRIPGLILNSPWLEMMGVPRPIYKALRPAIRGLGKLLPTVVIPGGNLTPYGQSLHSSEHGEWNFNLEWKPISGHPARAAWLTSVFDSFERVHRGEITLNIPILTVCSSRSLRPKKYQEGIIAADCVVDVQQTMKWAQRLGTSVDICPIPGACHEVYASRTKAALRALETTSSWLQQFKDCND